MRSLGEVLEEVRLARIAEILVVFSVALVVVAVGWESFGNSPFARQAVLWIANVGMLLAIWTGLRLRGQTWKHLGLSFHVAGRRAIARTLLQSVLVFVAALVAFVAGGAVFRVSLDAGPERADMSGYDYLQGNLPMLLLALAAVYVVSSFGEEVVYRGFLVTRLAELGKSKKAAWGIAVLISAVVFGLVHFEWGVVGIVQTAFMGLALAISYLVVRRNLWVLVLAHVYIDTLLLVQIYLGPSG